MFFATGLRWKRHRFIINPTFSSGKLKQMTPLIHQSLAKLLSKMEEQCQTNQPFNIAQFYQRFTMDSIWSCGFGIDTDMQNNTNDPYLVHSQQIFNENANVRVLILAALFINELGKYWRALHIFLSNVRYFLRKYIPIMKLIFNENPSLWIMKQAKTMIKRKQSISVHQRRTDLLQLMLESATNVDFIQVKLIE